MKAKLIVEGREFPIEIQDPELQKLLMPKKQTGYERVQNDTAYYYVDCAGFVCDIHEDGNCSDNDCYKIGNYYSDKTVAENNARADKLMRQLRRFAVEHREQELRWKIGGQRKYNLYYNYTDDEVCVNYDIFCQVAFCPYFDSEEVAKEAIKTFHDELIWYFTEYKDSL